MNRDGAEHKETYNEGSGKEGPPVFGMRIIGINKNVGYCFHLVLSD